MIQRLIYGLAWGFGLTIPAVLGILALIYSIEQYDNYEREKRWSKESTFQDIHNYAVISPSHRIIKGTEDDDGLYITGEVTFEQPKSNDKFDKVHVIATLRNAEGGYVDACRNQRKPVFIKNGVFNFKIRCRHILSADEFSTYDFRVEGELE